LRRRFQSLITSLSVRDLECVGKEFMQRAFGNDLEARNEAVRRAMMTERGAMKIIGRRLLKLERALASPVTDVGWGRVAHTHNEILCLAATWCDSPAAELKANWMSLGPDGLWLEGSEATERARICSD
jgi:hypothetical protein